MNPYWITVEYIGYGSDIKTFFFKVWADDKREARRKAIEKLKDGWWLDDYGIRRRRQHDLNDWQISIDKARY